MGMVVDVSNLSEFLANAKGDRSIDDIAKKAESAGHRISRSVVAKYLRGEHGTRPPEATLIGLAAGFGLDVRTLRKLAGRPAGEPEPYQPPAVSSSLTRKQRAALDQLILAMVEGEEDAGSAEAQKKPVKSLGEEFAQLDGVPELTRQDDVDLAARHGQSTGRAEWERAQKLGEETQDNGGNDPA